LALSVPGDMGGAGSALAVFPDDQLGPIDGGI
jgi:hypothetical protein